MYLDPFYTVRPALNMATATTTAILRPPAVYVCVQSGDDEALVDGYPVCWSTDGITVGQPTTAMLNCFAGIAIEAIAAFATPVYSYGLIQVYGYHDGVYVMAAEATAAAGDTTIPVNGAWYMMTQTAANTGLNFGVVQVLEAYTSTTVSAAKKCFIHAM